MGDPVSIGMTAASTALSVGTAGMRIAGRNTEAGAQASADRIEAMRMETAAEAAKVRAVQLDAQYRDELNETLSTIDSIRAAQNVNIDSPTSRAMQESARTRSARARTTAKSNERIKALGHEGDAQLLLNRSRQHSRSALLKSVPDYLSAGQAIIGLMR